jgi:hypothetical protein
MILWSKSKRTTIRICLILFAMDLICPVSFAVNEAVSSTKKQATLQILFFKGSDSARTAVVRVKESDENKKLINVTGVAVNFYTQDHDTLLFLQKVMTDEQGTATLVISKKIPVDAEGKMNILAKIENNADYADAEISGSIKEASILLHETVADTIKSINAVVNQVDADGKSTPLKDVDVTFYVKRMFGLMKLGEDATVTTNENGTATINFPANIKGDAEGTVIILARIENDENYGTVETKTLEKWGVPVAMENNPFPRTLWGFKAPLWMLISFLAAVSGITITLMYVGYQLYKIKTEPS